jgi:GT2 family glycosyltransferase
MKLLARVKDRWNALRGRKGEAITTHKQATRALLRIRLELFLSAGGTLALPRGADPDVTVIVITYNQPELVYGCVSSIAETLGSSELRVEVVILDNGSTADTLAVLDRVRGATVIRSETNLHFLLGVNRAAREARGRHLLLLNSDAQLLPGTLEAAVRTLESAKDIGAVGARIVLPDGTLQEAGSIIWNDGTCHGYGRGRPATDGEFMFRRDVDYCSGAFLLTPRALWEKLGGFDERYVPCYYEETDYCVRLWESGCRVVYEPDAVILHYEFGSSSMSQGISWQIDNLGRFRERHQAWLALQHEASESAPLAARSRPSMQLRVLMIEDRVPHVKSGGGYPRANSILRELVAAGARVTLFPMAAIEEQWPLVRESVDDSVEVLVQRSAFDLHDFLRERRGMYDAIVVCRPHNMETYVDALTRTPGLEGDAFVLYDAEALFAPRDAVRRQLAGQPFKPGEMERELAAEIALARRADAVVSVSAQEKAVFEEHGIGRTWLLGHAIAPRPTAAPFDARDGFVFLGALYDDNSPNAESLRWFAAEILPRLRQHFGAHLKLGIVGGVTAPSILALAPDAFELLGPVDDLATVFARARVMVAPTRIAAGIPTKVHDAAALGVPVVTTDLIASQLGWTPGVDVLASSDPAAFAKLCVELHSDRELWARVRSAALERVSAECSPERFSRTMREILAAVAAREARHAGGPAPVAAAPAPARAG